MQSLNLDGVPARELFPGYRGRLVHSTTMTLAYWDVDAGAPAPEHSHPHEQILTLVEGEFELTVGDETESLIESVSCGTVVSYPD